MKICLMPLILLVALLAAGCSDDSSQPFCDGCVETGSIPLYDFTKTYSTSTFVTHRGKTYLNNWWANPNDCPVADDCRCGKDQSSGCFQAGQWTEYDKDKPHEFAYYDYPAIKQEYPDVDTCTEADYNQASVRAIIDASIADGDLKKAAPDGGYTDQDKEALYREYMLPCMPDFSVSKPANVETVKRVMPYEKWKELASHTYEGDYGQRYIVEMDGELCNKPWPAEDGFAKNSYDNFLKAVARYPFFCGEKGCFSSVDEACKRELASLFAHAAQETGNGNIYQSFYWLREHGAVNGDQKFNTGCGSPFKCPDYARYYGRGPKQLTYYYNYAGFSAAYFNGNFNFLLEWPDMAAYDGAMFFTSAIWFVMTHQPPKPSIHDIMLGRYQPAKGCAGGADCYGLAYDATTGVKHNFNVTIEVVNGGPECRGANQSASKKRSDAFMQMLDLLGAVKTGSELNPVDGCEFIANTAKGLESSIFAAAPTTLDPHLHTWMELDKDAKNRCKAQDKGGNAVVSVTAPGIYDACMSVK